MIGKPQNEKQLDTGHWTPDTSPGYSGRPLIVKLGFKPGDRVKTLNAPANYLDLIAPIPATTVVSDQIGPEVDACHFFTTSRHELEKMLPLLRHEIKDTGMIWVSWPKKSSGVPSEITEDDIREVALPLGLVDIKVCAVDAVWSGLKLVIRRDNRRG